MTCLSMSPHLSSLFSLLFKMTLCLTLSADSWTQWPSGKMTISPQMDCTVHKRATHYSKAALPHMYMPAHSHVHVGHINVRSFSRSYS